MSGRDTGIASRLRSAGLRVVEVDGWQSRGSTDFAPGGSVHHHTAGPSSGAAPSLNTCIHGRPDLAGPLCNVFQSREPDGRDIAYVVAAGRANHAGEGGWRGLSGNRSVYGLEVEHTGTSAVPQGRIDIGARIHAAMFSGDPAMVAQHREWTSRKIDFATNVDGDDFRRRVAEARKPKPTTRKDLAPVLYVRIQTEGSSPQRLLSDAGKLYVAHGDDVQTTATTPILYVRDAMWNALIQGHGGVVDV